MNFFSLLNYFQTFNWVNTKICW